jgi:hypothetical protein
MKLSPFFHTTLCASPPLHTLELAGASSSVHQRLLMCPVLVSSNLTRFLVPSLPTTNTEQPASSTRRCAASTCLGLGGRYSDRATTHQSATLPSSSPPRTARRHAMAPAGDGRGSGCQRALEWIWAGGTTPTWASMPRYKCAVAEWGFWWELGGVAADGVPRLAWERKRCILSTHSKSHASAIEADDRGVNKRQTAALTWRDIDIPRRPVGLHGKYTCARTYSMYERAHAHTHANASALAFSL